MASSASTFVCYSYRARFLSLEKPHPSAFPTKLSFSAQLAQKFFYFPRRDKGVSSISVNCRRFEVQVKASMAETARSDKVKIEVFEKEELSESLAKYVADLSNKFTNERGSFTVVLSGGSLIDYMR